MPDLTEHLARQKIEAQLTTSGGVRTEQSRIAVKVERRLSVAVELVSTNSDKLRGSVIQRVTCIRQSILKKSIRRQFVTD